MSLAAIFNAVSAQCTAELQAQDWGSSRRPDLALPAMLFGPAGKTSKGAAPQIAWVFGNERFEVARKPYVPRSEAGDQPRFLKTGWQTFEVHLWAVCNFIGPVQSSGSGQGALSFTGPGGAQFDARAGIVPTLTANAAFAIAFIQILTAGAVGVATFRYSLDGGVTYSGPVTTGANIQLGTTGVFVSFFTPGTARPSFSVGDLFQFSINANQISDYDTCETLVNSFISAVNAQLYGGYLLGSGSWSGQDGSELTQMGKEYTLMLEIATPVTEVGAAPAALAKVTSTDQFDILGSTTTHP